jgi:hypothetical protein
MHLIFILLTKCKEIQLNRYEKNEYYHTKKQHTSVVCDLCPGIKNLRPHIIHKYKAPR